MNESVLSSTKKGDRCNTNKSNLKKGCKGKLQHLKQFLNPDIRNNTP